MISCLLKELAVSGICGVILMHYIIVLHFDAVILCLSDCVEAILYRAL